MKRNAASRGFKSGRLAQGLSLVELLVAMVLGLVVVGVAIGIFMSNRQTYRATENLARVQENARTAFELMARDVREAGGNPCVNNLPIVNVLNGSAGSWWTNLDNWGNAMRGFGATEPFPSIAFGTAAGARLSGTDAIQMISGDDSVVTISAHNTAGAQFTVNTTNHGVAANDLLLACNARQASVFQASSVGSNTISHAAGGTSPGNCTTGLGLPRNCSGTSIFEFSAPNSVLVRLHSTRWYIANNGRGGRSLYQTRLTSGTTENQEVAEGVQNMQITYLMSGGIEYVDAGAVNAVANGWANVVATRIVLTLQGTQQIDGSFTTRQLIHIASLRNRNA